MRIGFIGLGTMGLPMAYSLRQNGFEVLGWDIDAAVADRFEYYAESLEMLAGHCDVFVTMLPRVGMSARFTTGCWNPEWVRIHCL